MSYDPENHHRRSIRLPAYDYAGNAVFFVTICTEGRALLFGCVVDGAMVMNELGWLIWEEWEKSAEIRSEIELGPFVVMPNHLHGVVTIVPEVRAGIVSSAQPNARFRRQPRSLGSFLAGFKATTTYRINALRGNGGGRVWQRNYHERVVRSEQEMGRIWSYIDNNPLRWTLDQENPDREGRDPFETWLQPTSGGAQRRP